jgi:hypothetical protein
MNGTKLIQLPPHNPSSGPTRIIVWSEKRANGPTALTHVSNVGHLSSSHARRQKQLTALLSSPEKTAL